MGLFLNVAPLLRGVFIYLPLCLPKPLEEGAKEVESLFISLAMIPTHPGSGARPQGTPLGDSALATHEEVALSTLQQAATAGDAEAQYRLFDRYASGHAPELTLAEARAWLVRATDQGYPAALYTSALLQLEAKGQPVAPPQALFYLEIAGDRGYTDAYLRLYSIYFYGQGVPVDRERAQGFLKKAMEQGSATAYLLVAKSLLPEGGATSVDYDTSYYYAEQAAQRGSQEAVSLIIELLEGNFVEGDHTELLSYWRRQLHPIH